MLRFVLSARIAPLATLLFLSFMRSVSAETYENITISVPAGTYYQPSTHTYCVPSRWFDVVAFFLTNYVAHAATVKSIPGEPVVPAILTSFFALLFPSSGVMRAMAAIRQRTALYSDPLTAATRAGALCMVVRTGEWTPQDGETVHGLTKKLKRKFKEKLEGELIRFGNSFVGLQVRTVKPQPKDDQSYELTSRMEAGESEDASRMSAHPGTGALMDDVWYEPDTKTSVVLKVESHKIEGQNIFIPSVGLLSSSGRKVFGTCCLPKGYGLMIVPSNALVVGLDGKRSKKDWRTSHTSKSYNKLSSSYSIAKPLVAILQILYASFTLYRTRGDQIDKYGYAAFGLTVAPYLIMSILNLVSSMLTADYASVFLVDSDIMQEAARRKRARFEGMVGKVKVADSGYGSGSFEARFLITEDGHKTMRRRHHTSDRPENEIVADSSNSVIHSDELPPQVPSGADRTLPSNASEPNAIQVPSFSLVEELGSSKILPLSFFSMIIAGGLSIGIVGGLSHFRVADSTLPQRAWTMTWLVWGFYMGPNIYTVLGNLFKLDFGTETGSTWLYLAFYLTYCAPAVGGFVVVGQMLKAYGTCYRTY